jgi:hypothetical protein
VIATAKPIAALTRTADKSRKRRFAFARARVPAELRRGFPGPFGVADRRFPRRARGPGRPSAGDAYLCAPRGEGPFFVPRDPPGAVLPAHSEKGQSGKPNGVATRNRAWGYAKWRSVSCCK